MTANNRFRVTRDIRQVDMDRSWEIELVGRSWCFLYCVMVQSDLSASGEPIDHYDPENPCPGPHGEMYAAVSSKEDAALMSEEIETSAVLYGICTVPYCGRARGVRTVLIGDTPKNPADPAPPIHEIRMELVCPDHGVQE